VVVVAVVVAAVATTVITAVAVVVVVVVAAAAAAAGKPSSCLETGEGKSLLSGVSCSRVQGFLNRGYCVVLALLVSASRYESPQVLAWPRLPFVYGWAW
jgi:hypothetical protein